MDKMRPTFCIHFALLCNKNTSDHIIQQRTHLFRIGQEVRLHVLPLVEDVLVHDPAPEREGVAVIGNGAVHQPQLLKLAALRLQKQHSPDARDSIGRGGGGNAYEG